MGGTDMLRKLGETAYQKRKLVLVIWAILILVFSFFASRLPTVLSGNGFEYQGEFKETKQILEKDFGQPRSSIILLFHKEKFIKNQEWYAFINETLQRLNGFSVTSPFDQENMMSGNDAYGIIAFNKDPESLGEEITQLHNLLKNKYGLTVSMTGEPIMVRDLNHASQSDLAKAEMIGLPIALIVLILSFGGIVAAAVPLIIGIVTILITMGIVYFYSYGTNLSIFILNIIPMIGLALSIDFALLFINRFKEEINHNPLSEAIQTTVATAGRSIIFSGLCVFIGLSGLLFIKIDIFQNVALGGMTVVFISALSAITFLPALLAVMGNNINKLSLFRINDTQSRFWHRFAMYVMKRPVLMAILAFTILVACLFPAKDMALKIPGIDSLPESYSSRIAFESFQKKFIPKEKREENRVIIIFESKGNIMNDHNLAKVRNVTQKWDKDPMVETVISPFSVPDFDDPDKLLFDDPTIPSVLDAFVKDNKMHVEVFLKSEVHSSKAREWVDDWSHRNLGIKATFGGHIKFEQEIFDEIYYKTPYGLLLIFVTTFIILTAAFHSLLIPIKAILMNILSLGCTFGIVVWIFQEGHLVSKPASIAMILPVFVFTLVFGLSMDYEVFLISRIQEFYLKTGNNSESTVNGLTYTSKIITSAAAIMIVVTGAFAFTGVMPIKQLGVGIAIAIFIDSTIVRMVLVPSLMKLLGDWNWWLFGFQKPGKKPA
jgi:putative drug exporter of the RND superfamily